jgi:hypothetical protein
MGNQGSAFTVASLATLYIVPLNIANNHNTTPPEGQPRVHCTSPLPGESLIDLFP